MADFHRFARDLIWLRRRHPALRAEPVSVFHCNDVDRVLAFHRWLPGVGRDVMVVVSLREETFHDHAYRLGFPLPGTWLEALNSDFYDHFPNQWVAGNAGGVVADGPAMHGLPHSAALTIPANGILIFTRDRGD